MKGEYEEESRETRSLLVSLPAQPHVQLLNYVWWDILKTMLDSFMLPLEDFADFGEDAPLPSEIKAIRFKFDQENPGDEGWILIDDIQFTKAF